MVRTAYDGADRPKIQSFQLEGPEDGHDLKNIVETLQAAETLATRGIEAEVLDMYSLKPCSQVPSVRWRPAKIRGMIICEPHGKPPTHGFRLSNVGNGKSGCNSD